MFKRFVKGFIDLSGVISAIPIYIAGFLYIVNFIKGNKFLYLLFSPIVIFGLMFLWVNIKKAKRDISESIYKGRLVSSLKKYQIKERKDIQKALPTGEVLELWYKELYSRAKSWSDDAKLMSLNLYIDFYSEIEPKFQAYFYSKWKDEELTTYFGKFNTSVFKEGASFYEEESMPFYSSFPKWREAVFRAYEMVVDKLPSEYELAIQGGVRLTISFDYKVNQLERSQKFTFDGKYITHSKSMRKIEI